MSSSAVSMASFRGNRVLCPQTLHLTAWTLGGTLLRLNLYFLPQPAHLKRTRSFSRPGDSIGFVAGFSEAMAADSFFNARTVSVSLARLNGTGRAQDLHFITFAAGGILSCRKLWLWPQYWQTTLTAWMDLADVSAGACFSGIGRLQALHLAALTLDGTFASSMS